MESNLIFYLIVFVGIVLAITIIKKVTSCLFKLILLAAIVAAIAAYYIYM